MKKTKKILISCLCIFLLICTMSLSAYAVDVVIYAKDANNNYVYGATFEVRGSDGTSYSNSPGNSYAGQTFALNAGTTYAFNVRKSDYAAGWTADFVCPNTSPTPKEATIRAKSTYTNASFGKPLASMPSISSKAGWRYLSNKLDFHTGIDLPKDEGTTIYGVHSGSVADVSTSAYTGSLGNWAQTKTTSGTLYYVRYSHMKDLCKLKIGDSVGTTTVIGYVGHTGTVVSGNPNSNGDHLHFDISTSSSVSRTTVIDPEAFY